MSCVKWGWVFGVIELSYVTYNAHSHAWHVLRAHEGWWIEEERDHSCWKDIESCQPPDIPQNGGGTRSKPSSKRENFRHAFKARRVYITPLIAFQLHTHSRSRASAVAEEGLNSSPCSGIFQVQAAICRNEHISSVGSHQTMLN